MLPKSREIPDDHWKSVCSAAIFRDVLENSKTLRAIAILKHRTEKRVRRYVAPQKDPPPDEVGKCPDKSAQVGLSSEDLEFVGVLGAVNTFFNTSAHTAGGTQTINVVVHMRTRSRTLMLDREYPRWR